MAKKKTTGNKTGPKKKLTTILHDQKRTNIPTEELRDFVSEDRSSQPRCCIRATPTWTGNS